MRPLEIISQLCEAINKLSDIVKKQQEEIERSKVEESVKIELRQMVNDSDEKLDLMEYHLRRVIDTDDGEPIQKGVADDD